MRYGILALLVIVTSAAQLIAQNRWVTTFGGSSRDEGLSVIATRDGGCVMAGSTESNDGDVAGVAKGSADAVVARFDNLGGLVWRRTFGGSQLDVAHAIALTADGGYVIVGETHSNDGDFAGGNTNVGGNIFVMLLNPQGDIRWKKVFGGSAFDGGLSVSVSPDQGIVLAGTTESNDGDFDGSNKGATSGFVMKLDQQGEVQWKTVLGGSNDDVISSVSATLDGGYVATGWTNSNDGYFDGANKGLDDIFIAKIDSLGTIKWLRSFGGTKSDIGHSITATSDGGCVATGYTESDDVDFTGRGRGAKDILVIKLDEKGDFQWLQLIGGSSVEEGYSITEVQGGGIVLAGYSSSNDGDFTGMNEGGRDIVILELDEDGTIQWNKTHGGSRADLAYSLRPSFDSGFILTGSTQSNNGAFEGMGKASTDAFVLKLDAKGDLNSSTSVDEVSNASQRLVASPNPIVSGARLSYTVARPSRVCIQVIDGLGNHVSTVFDGYATEGVHHAMMSTSELAAGHYTVRMATQDAVAYTSVIVR